MGFPLRKCQLAEPDIAGAKRQTLFVQTQTIDDAGVAELQRFGDLERWGRRIAFQHRP
jgi:hypothetical protein